MKFMPVIALSILFSSQVYAQAQYSLSAPANGGAFPESLLGTWGTAEQCAAHRQGKYENPGLYPYRITAKWIRQGDIYCQLTWDEHIDDVDVLRADAFAQCGEDNLREYRLRLNLQAGKLKIRWSKDFTTRELRSC